MKYFIYVKTTTRPDWPSYTQTLENLGFFDITTHDMVGDKLTIIASHLYLTAAMEERVKALSFVEDIEIDHQLTPQEKSTTPSSTTPE